MDLQHELTIVIGQLAALRCDCDQLDRDEIRGRLDELIDGARACRDAAENNTPAAGCRTVRQAGTKYRSVFDG